ncbi:MAG: fumarylacetoacetate hydrolase family protein [Alphaproteobacteria bacterium]|nr:fumarylacetoacetate hydrolase family protein [Alphaproteobacteria bacterium]
MTLDAAAVDTAAGELFRARRDHVRLDWLPETCRPVDREDGYAVQSSLFDRLLASSGGHRVGYKIGATNPAAREMLETDQAFAGSLLSTLCHPGPHVISAAEWHVIVVEPEIAVRLGRDLPATGSPHTPTSVADAVEAVAPAIEVVTSPFPVWNQAGIGCIIADNGANGCWVHGPFQAEHASIDLAAIDITLSINGEVEKRGTGSNVDGGPLVVLAWLANELNSRGSALKAGDLVTTGSTTQPVPGAAGQEFVADFGVLGSCRLTIT